MPHYLVSIHHPDNYDPSTETKEMDRDIDVLNNEMVAAGARVYVGGLRPVAEAKSICSNSHGLVEVFDGPFLKTNEHVGGFWVLECKSIEEALEWGRKATNACRAPVEVRPFY